LALDPKTLVKLQEIENLEDLQPDSDYEQSDSDEEAKKEKGKQMEYEDMLEGIYLSSNLDESIDEYDEDYEHKLVNKMDEEITQRYKEHKDYLMDANDMDKEEKLMKKKIAKGKRNMALQIENSNQLEIKKYNNKDIKEDEDSDESMSDDELAVIRAIEQKNRKRTKIAENEEFINPLVATKKDMKRFKKALEEKRNEDEESDKDSFDSDVEELAKKLDKQKLEEKEKKKKRDRKRKEKEDDEEVGKGFEEVKAEKTYSDYDSDDIAEIRAIGKKMLRKKDRLELIDSAYNRYAFTEDPDTLPSWFAEEENKFNKPIPPVTKEEIRAEKKFLKEYNARPSAKIAEFKERKKRKMLKAMAKVRQKANQIANSDELNNGSKMRQIKKLYGQEKKKLDEKFNKRKSVVVARAFSKSAPGKTQGRKYKMVDRRLKKDTRAMKRSEKNSKGKGKRIRIKK
jgi:AdoMet-dependent rRNA methyltransferase SPB1